MTPAAKTDIIYRSQMTGANMGVQHAGSSRFTLISEFLRSGFYRIVSAI
jgi:hypothetical protein